MSISTSSSTLVYQEFYHNATIQIAVTVLVALLLWRLWTFTIRPRFHPEEPKELPYWIPYFGHVRSFFVDYTAALEYGRIYFKDSKEPYSVWLGKLRIYIVTSPTDIANCYRNTTTISYHHIIRDMYKWMHISQDGIDKMFAIDPSAAHNTDLPKPQAAAFALNNYHRLQVHPGENFDDLLHRRLTPSITHTLDFENFVDHPAVLARSKNEVTVSLLELCNELFVRGTTDAFMGKAIWKINPDLLDAFRRWERTNWKYMFQMPAFMSRDMAAARDEIVNSFLLYFRLPIADRSDCNYFMKAAEKIVREVGCNDDDMSRIFMLHFWAILGNIYKVAFWTFAHLVYDPALLDAIRTEASSAMMTDTLDELYLAEQCPKLDSVISEILRLTVASALVREVIAPTRLGGKILQPGNKLLVPYRQLHLNRDVWGNEPLHMEPFRFERNVKLQNSKSYRPFGGGGTLCPGRFVAKRAIGYAVALMVLRYDMVVDSTRTQKGGEKNHGDLPPFPRLDTTKPSPGAGLPHVGDDLVLRLKKRT